MKFAMMSMILLGFAIASNSSRAAEKTVYPVGLSATDSRYQRARQVHGLCERPMENGDQHLQESR